MLFAVAGHDAAEDETDKLVRHEQRKALRKAKEEEALRIRQEVCNCPGLLGFVDLALLWRLGFVLLLFMAAFGVVVVVVFIVLIVVVVLVAVVDCSGRGGRGG